MNAPQAWQSCRLQALFGFAALLALTATAALSQATQQQSQMTLQLQAPLVLEDIVVLDSHNQPVHNLKAADFTLTDDGKPVRLQSFEEHAAPTSAQQAAQLASAPKPPSLGVNVFTNYTPTPPDSPLNILLIDALNTPITAQDSVHRQVVKYLSNQPVDQRMAIFVLTTRLYLLQGFTADPALLKAAITSKGSHIEGSPLLQDATGGDTAEGLYNSSFFQCSGKACGPQETRQMQEDTATVAVSERVNRTLDAFDELAHYLSALPGRKNLIWFSAAFPIQILPDFSLSNLDLTAGDLNPSAPAAHYEQIVRQMDDLLARNHVIIYPIDARGIFGNPASNASHEGPNPIANPTMVHNATMASESNFALDTSQEHETLDQMAYDTGGKAFYNTGDLAKDVADAIRFGSNYYSTSYTPPSGK